MIYGNLSKSKYSSNVVSNKGNKAKETKDSQFKAKIVNTSEKELLSTSNTFRPGMINMITSNKFKTGKNSRK